MLCNSLILCLYGKHFPVLLSKGHRSPPARARAANRNGSKEPGRSSLLLPFCFHSTGRTHVFFPLPLLFALRGKETICTLHWGNVIEKWKPILFSSASGDLFSVWCLVKGSFSAAGQLPGMSDFLSTHSYDPPFWQRFPMTAAVMLGHGKLSSKVVHEMYKAQSLISAEEQDLKLKLVSAREHSTASGVGLMSAFRSGFSRRWASRRCFPSRQKASSQLFRS